MKPAEAVRAVLTDTGSHPVAVIVHSLALLIGVTATVLAVAVGLGGRRAARLPFEGLTPNQVVVSATTPSSSGVEVGLPSSTLTRDDAQALSDRGFVPDAVAAAPTAGLRADVVSLARSWTTDVIGSTPAFSAVRGYSIVRGRFLTAADVASAAPVVVVGETVAQRLFTGDDPVGQQLQIGDHSLQVVGVFSERGFSGTFDQDDLAVMPITTTWADLLGNKTTIDQVLIQASSPGRAAAVKAEAVSTLLQRHGFSNPAQADFEVHTLKDLTAQEEQTATAVKRSLLLAAAALLLVAAIDLDAETMGSRWSEHQSAIPLGRPGSFVEAMARSAVVTVLGVALAAASVGLLRQLVGGIPPPELRWSALAWGAVAGLLAGFAAWTAGAVRFGQLSRLGQASRLGLLP